MNLKEAIELSQKHKNVPIVRQCCECHSWLDEASELIVAERGRVEFIISHGLCEPCVERLYPDHEEPIPDTIKST